MDDYFKIWSPIPGCNSLDEEESKCYIMLIISREGKYVLV